MKYIPLFLVALLAILSGCADKDKKGDAAAFGDATDDIYDQPLPERSGKNVGVMQAYMNPYQQGVIDVAKQSATREYQQGLNQIRA